MSMYDWAERECRIACKKENPNFNFDDDGAFDYGCSCYKSALKAYKSLCDDGHSGCSFAVTRNILKRLLDGNPLTPITDEDFLKQDSGEVSEWMKEKNIRSIIQCSRKGSLFRTEYMDGTVKYHDNDRQYFVNVEDPSCNYTTNSDFLDEMFPITMPYFPDNRKYAIYEQTSLVDAKHGDYDTKGIMYVITPDGQRIDVGIYKTEGDDHKMHTITKEEYDKLLEKRIDKVSITSSDRLLFTLIRNSGLESEIDEKEKGWKETSDEFKSEKRKELERLCVFFDNPEHYKYNTFNVRQDLANGRMEDYKDIPELMVIGHWLQELKKTILSKSK